MTFATLAAGGYVPPGVSPTNAFGQTWEVRIIEPVENQLQGLVVGVPAPGALEVPAKQLTAAASTAGFSGGYTPVTGLPGVDTVAQGAFGSWTAAFGGGANQFGAAPGAGSLVGLLAVNGGGTAGDDQFLHRRADPLNPQLNAMQTDLSMINEGGVRQNITGANRVEATRVEATDVQATNVNSTDVTSTRIRGDEVTVNNTLSVIGGAVQVSAGVGAAAACDPNVALKIGDSSFNTNCAGRLSVKPGQAGSGVMDVGGFIKVNQTTSITVGASCVEEGVVGRSASELLICRNTPGGLVWQRVGGLDTASAGDSCNSFGGYAQDIGGNGLICQSGRYMPVQTRMGSWQLITSLRVRDGSNVPLPSCSNSSVPRIILHLKDANTVTTRNESMEPVTDVAVNSTTNELNVTKTPLGFQVITASGISLTASAPGPGGWTVQMRDGANQPLVGESVATVYCAY